LVLNVALDDLLTGSNHVRQILPLEHLLRGKPELTVFTTKEGQAQELGLDGARSTVLMPSY